MGMSEKTIDSYGKGFLVLILPISVAIIFFVNTWRIWMVLVALLIGWKLFQSYRWQQWCTKVNPTFHQLVERNQGKITPIDLAIKGSFSGTKAKRYLDTKAGEFGARIIKVEDGEQVYHFITAKTLSSLLDSSEPELEEISTPALKSTSTPILAALEPPLEVSHTEHVQDETISEEIKADPQHLQEEKQPLEKQLLFGSLIQSDLAKRLGVYSSTVFKRRNDPKFSEWSRNRDPDGIAWTYSKETKEFFPLDEEA